MTEAPSLLQNLKGRSSLWAIVLNQRDSATIIRVNFETDDFETLTKLTKTGCIQFTVFAIRNRRERSVREDQSVMYPPNSADEPPC